MKISLIGDSIRMQYQKPVAELLGDDFEIFAPAENCRFARYNLRGMWDWKEGMRGSRIVHWNCGLWDICELFGDGLFTSLDEYVSTTLRVADILLSRHEKVIFATTTPVRNENIHNKNEWIEEYNNAIVPKLREKGVIINDLYSALSVDVDRFVSDDLIHLSEEGIEKAARMVADVVLKASAELDQKLEVSKKCKTDDKGVPVIFG